MNVDAQTVWHAAAVYTIPILFAIAMHEVAHGWTARMCGDPTAAEEGRLSINPLRHIDPIGTILLPLVLYALIGMPFGYARPVPVDFSRLRKPRTHTIYVALAGPLANVAMGLAWVVVHRALLVAGVNSPVLYLMSVAGMQINAIMVVFNLLPVPPLDGGRVLVSLLPAQAGRWMERIENYHPWPLSPLADGETATTWAERLRQGADALRVYDIAVFTALILLIKLHVLDGFLARLIALAMRLFNHLAFPFLLLLS